MDSRRDLDGRGSGRRLCGESQRSNRPALHDVPLGRYARPRREVLAERLAICRSDGTSPLHDNSRPRPARANPPAPTNDECRDWRQSEPRPVTTPPRPGYPLSDGKALPPSFAGVAEPIREELWGVERLEQHAASLAAAQRVRPGRWWDRRLAPRVRRNARVLVQSYPTIAASIPA